MNTAPELNARLLAARDDEAALTTLRGGVAVPSITGEEEAYARHMAQELETMCTEVRLDVFAPHRANVWARWGESQTAADGLLFVGHLDTVHVAGWREHWAGTELEDPFAGTVKDGSVWGRGVGDVKAGISAVLSALALLHRAGLRPAAPVTVLLVADEESGEPDSGKSEGIRRALDRSKDREMPLRGDLAVYVEPTELNIYTAHMGFFTTDITISGRSAYFGTPELGVDALQAGAQVLQALWDYDAELRTRPAADLIGGPFLLVTGMESGGYIAVPGECRISLIRKLTPTEDLDDARAELDKVIASATGEPDITVRVEYPAGRDHPVGGTPMVTDPTIPAIGLLGRTVRNHYPPGAEIQGAPYWSEGPFLNRLGIPTVYCAPGDIRNCHTFEERVSVDQYLASVSIFAEFIVAHCGVVEQT